MPILYDIYQSLSIPAPTNGMNMHIDEESLPTSFAASLANFIPDPIGAITLRNGTKKVKEFGKEVVYRIPFTVKDGSEDYFDVLMEPVKVGLFTGLTQDEKILSFDRNLNPEELKYLIFRNKILVKSPGGSYVRQITKFLYDYQDSSCVIGLDASIDDEVIGDITEIYYYKCSLYHDAKLLYSFLPTSKMRAFNCLNKILLCTGTDPIQIFDEANDNLYPLVDRVFLKVTKNGDSFKITHQNYQQAHLNKYVSVQVGNTDYELYDKQLDSFKLRDQNGNYPGNSGTFKFIVSPPQTAFCSVIGNRIWFLGEGATSLDFKSRDEAMIASYGYNVNLIDNFLNPKTGLIPSLVVENSKNDYDSLERIGTYFKYLVFFGKKYIYFYNGFYPEDESFAQSHDLPCGLYHPDHLQEVDNDIIFLTEGGFRKVSSLSIVQQTPITDINGLDPLVSTLQADKDHFHYLYSNSVFYAFKRQIMFKLGQNETIVFSIKDQKYIPYLFIGDFTYSTSISQGRNSIFLCYGNKVLSYQEETENPQDEVSGKIDCIWATPTYSFVEHTFSTKKIIFNADCDPEFAISLKNKISNLTLKIDGISGITSKKMRKRKEIQISSFGDFIEGFAVRRSKNYGMLTSVEHRKSLRLVMRKIKLVVTGKSSSGRIKIRNINILGVKSHG